MMNPEINLEKHEAEEDCLTRHRKERKELQAEIQRLKCGVSKGDKKRKKEIAAEIAVLENNLSTRQEEELKEVKKLSEELTSLCITDQSNGIEDYDVTSDQTTEQPSRISKSQKRKSKKAQRDAEAIERIRQGEMESMFSERRIEADKFQKLLHHRGLKMCQIPSNGDCLYAAVVHQLGQCKINSNVPSLRRQAANYMREHIDEFLPFLVKEDTGDLYTQEGYLEYCDKVEHTSEWGGQAELRALSDTLSARIEVIQADGPSVFIGNQFGEDSKIVITYHRHAYGLGEHYNSIEPCAN